MPKDKERSVNPAAAQRKAEKQRALKKGKAVVAAQRNERLAHRNPERLQRQIDELKELESSRGGELSQRDKTQLADLERDVARIRKARDAVGDKASSHRYGDENRGQRHEREGAGRRYHDGDGGGSGGRKDGQILGKRGRSPDRRGRFSNRRDNNNNGDDDSVSSATDEDVHDIPMPRDTPPPIPRRRRWQHRDREREDERGGGGNNNDRRRGEGEEGEGAGGRGMRQENPLPPKPAPAASQTVYESKPVIRDLQREAAGFVPNVVKRKLDAVKGGADQPLMEEEELERLEREGYGRKKPDQRVDEEQETDAGQAQPATNADDDNDMDEEMQRFTKDVRHVQIEEVEDEDA